MKALVLNDFGGIENFAIAEVEKPKIQSGQILVKVYATGINPIDYKTRLGKGVASNFQLPAILGWDISGVVEEVAPNVINFAKGDEVFGFSSFPKPSGAYAEYAAVNASDMALKPSNISFCEAAAFPIAGLTAYQALTESARVLSGYKVLIQAAAGGVGHLAVQIAKRMGAFVIGVSSKRNRNFLFDLGVEEYINYEHQPFELSTKNIDYVLDGMGGDISVRSVKVIRPNGNLVVLPSMYRNDETVLKACAAANVNVFWHSVHTNGQQLQTLSKMLQSNEIKVHISQEFSLQTIPEAHKLLEAGHVRGKLVAKII